MTGLAATELAAIELREIHKQFGGVDLLRNFSLSVPAGAVVCLLGPSGCGKTTVLNIIAGLVGPDSGSVLRSGRISFVFQFPRLLPWETVLGNALYAMDSSLPRRERRRTAIELLEELELGDNLDKRPGEISGGMAQRTALARGLLAPFQCILLDEPVSSLDPDMRQRVIDRLKKTLGGKSAVLVTHDYGAASALSDEIYRFGRLPAANLESVDAAALKDILAQIESSRQA